MRLIVGVDSGKKNAVAIFDTHGNLIKVKSNIGKREIVGEIIKHGKPIIIACDVNKASELAKKLASTFNAKLVCPSKNLSVRKKKKLCSKINYKPKNSHERDAIASAVFAIKNYRKLFMKIEKRAKDINMADEVKELLLKRKCANIKHALYFVKKEKN